jgi:ketose-bisphosphate aldolase
MPIRPLDLMISEARRGCYALCYLESWNLESLQAVLEAAAERRAPVIAGFNGGFLSRRAKPEDLSYYAAFRAALERSPVPVAFLLNESDDLAQIEEAIRLGFNAVMPEGDGLDRQQYTGLVRAVVARAHPAGVWVEAQCGTLPGWHNGTEGALTDPGAARRFVDDTGIDALAVSIGNVHVLTHGHAAVDWDVLSRIRERVDVPLVVHGGTGLCPRTLGALARAGVSKINFGTALKQAYLEAVRGALSKYRPPASPHEFLGMGGPDDIMIAARNAVKHKAAELLEACECAGRAD